MAIKTATMQFHQIHARFISSFQAQSKETRVAGNLYRAKVPGGWLISSDPESQATLTFLPDPDHGWDGNSLE